jgi:hypothetical protein
MGLVGKAVSPSQTFGRNCTPAERSAARPLMPVLTPSRGPVGGAALGWLACVVSRRHEGRLAIKRSYQQILDLGDVLFERSPTSPQFGLTAFELGEVAGVVGQCYGDLALVGS